MLRIKESVNLKELKKFGFVKNIYCPSYCYLNKNKLSIVECWEDDRYLSVDNSGGNSEKILDLLFDLIQAGLVEKVEG